MLGEIRIEILGGVLGLICGHHFADGLGTGNGAIADSGLDLRLIDHPAGQTCHHIEGHADISADDFGLVRVTGIGQLDSQAVVLMVGHSQRRGIQTIDVQQQRIQSRNSTGGAICVNDRDIVYHGDQHGNEGVETADLNGKRVAQGAAHVRSHIHQSVVGVDGIGSKVYVLQCNGRTHTSGHSSIGADVHLFSRDHAQFRLTMFLDVVLQHLQTGAGRTTTAGTQDGGTIDDVDDILTRQNSRHFEFLHIL